MGILTTHTTSLLRITFSLQMRILLFSKIQVLHSLSSNITHTAIFFLPIRLPHYNLQMFLVQIIRQLRIQFLTNCIMRCQSRTFPIKLTVLRIQRKYIILLTVKNHQKMIKVCTEFCYFAFTPDLISK